MTDLTQGRRLTPSALMQHWDSGVAVAIPIAGTPALRLRIDKPRGRVTLRAPLSVSGRLPVNPLAHVAVETVLEEGDSVIDISTTDARIVLDGYAMLMAVADRIQIEGFEPLAALEETLKTWGSILSTRTRLSAEAEVGLFGELLVVRAILATDVASAAAWRGGFGEEHDFGFPDADVEVKTTSGEKRRHWIHGLTQMVETGNTPLWLLSVQVTRGGEQQGKRLPDLIDDVSSMTDESGRTRIEANLARIGWNDGQRDLFDERWRLRSAPMALRVDAAFPRLTPVLLSRAGVDTASLRQVAYEIDVTDREGSRRRPPSTLTAIVRHLGEAADG